MQGLRPRFRNAMLACCALPSMALAGAIHDTALFADHTLAPFDDTYSGNFPSFPIDFFGSTASALSVSSNGALTHGNLWPIDFDQLQQHTPIIAPFFANIDNRYGGTIQWGFDLIGGRQVLGAQWLDVMAYGGDPDKRNSFQLIITDRSDVAVGAFDFEFNYDTITWDTSAHAWWEADPSPDIARAGYASQDGLTLFELPGSGIAGALLDDNPETGLIHHSRNASVDGRYLFEVRGGVVLPEVLDPPPVSNVPEPGSLALFLSGLGVLASVRRRA